MPEQIAFQGAQILPEGRRRGSSASLADSRLANWQGRGFDATLLAQYFHGVLVETQGGIAVSRLVKQPLLEQRTAKQRPRLRTEVFADAIGGELVVTIGANTLSVGSTQNIDDVAHAKAL